MLGAFFVEIFTFFFRKLKTKRELQLRIFLIWLIWGICFVSIFLAIAYMESGTDAFILILYIIALCLCSSRLYCDIKAINNEDYETEKRQTKQAKQLKEDLFFKVNSNSNIKKEPQSIVIKTTIEEQEKKEMKGIIFEGLDKLHNYLKENKQPGLPVSHKQFGVGETRTLKLGENNSEYLIVEFLCAKGEKNKEIKFSYPNCFLQGKLTLLGDWKEKIGKIDSESSIKKAIVRGEKINEKQADILRTYIQENPSLSIMAYHIANNQERGCGRIVKIENNTIEVSFQNCYRRFSYPTAFISGELRLVEGTMERIKKYYSNRILQFKKELEILEKLDREGKVEIGQKVMPQESTGQKSNKIIRADTNAEFLNKVFKTNYKQWYKSAWRYKPDIIIWMVRFYGRTELWKNRFIDEDTIREEYLGDGDMPPIEGWHTKRIPAAIEERGVSRRYEIKGLFEWVPQESGKKFRIYKRVKNDMITPMI